MVHTAAEIAAFLDGETRLITAVRRDHPYGELFILPDGQADQYRALARAELRCPIWECTAPALTTVSRSQGRDGFRHIERGAGRHAPEGLFHRQGKAVLAAWLRERYPGSTVTVEHGIDSQRSSVPDVLITAPTGERIAFEVQYAAISVAEWRERHRRYQEAGVIDVWLFGHTGPNLRRQGQEFRLSALHSAVHAAGLPLLWFNPVEAALATTAGPQWWFVIDKDQTGAPFQLEVEPLAAARLHRDGVRSPAGDRIAAEIVTAQLEYARWQRQDDAKRAQQRARLTRLTARWAKEEERRRRGHESVAAMVSERLANEEWARGTAQRLASRSAREAGDGEAPGSR